MGPFAGLDARDPAAVGVAQEPGHGRVLVDLDAAL